VVMCFGGIILGVFLGGYDVSSICGTIVSCFVHTLRLAGTSFNNICRLKKKGLCIRYCLLGYDFVLFLLILTLISSLFIVHWRGKPKKLTCSMLMISII